MLSVIRSLLVVADNANTIKSWQTGKSGRVSGPESHATSPRILPLQFSCQASSSEDERVKGFRFVLERKIVILQDS